MTAAGGLGRIAIVGGDLDGWTAAAALARAVQGMACEVTVVELPDVINTEPAQFTAPATLDFFRGLGIDEDELIRRSGATFRLGTGLHYRNAATDHRILAFGPHGAAARVVPFHHYVVRARLAGAPAHLNAFSPNAIAAQAGRMIRPGDDEARALPPLEYGLNLNTEKLTRLLKDHAILNGATATSRSVDAVRVEARGTRIERLVFDDGAELAADLFIDCSGETGLLIGGALGVRYDSWAHFLPCTRMVALTTPFDRDETPVHHLAAVDAGWLSTTPLQQRAAHRLLYAPRFLDDEAARAQLVAHAQAAGSEPEAIAATELKSGCRRQQWVGNCVAIGGAAGAVEPLDFGSLELAERAVSELAAMLPATPRSPTLADEFNRRMLATHLSLRDFTRLHYAAARWRQTPFWADASAGGDPASLREKIETFTSRGHLEPDARSIVPDAGWIAALMAAGFVPGGYHGLLDYMDALKLDEHYGRMRQAMIAAVGRMPGHRDYVRRIATGTRPGQPPVS